MMPVGASERALPQKKVLIVDDDADFRTALSTFLEAQGYRVIQAGDGRQGLTLAKMERPDLILMDIVMTERTEGFFSVQEIRHSEELKDVPVFVLTSLYSQEPDFQIAPETAWLAHDEFFHKPVDLTLLAERIRQRIGGPEEKVDNSAARRHGQ
jgi:DNA-binding response OmpR family regulator